MLNFSFISREFSLDVYFHILFLFLRSNLKYLIGPEALVDGGVIGSEILNKLTDAVKNGEEYSDLGKSFYTKLERMFENRAAYMTFRHFGLLLSYCMPQNEKLRTSFDQAVFKVSLLVTGKMDIYGEEGEMILNFNKMEKDYNNFCVDSAKELLMVLVELEQPNVVELDEYDFENTISCKNSRRKSFANISKYFQGDSRSITLSKIGSLSSSNNDKPSIYSALMKDDKLIEDVLMEILVKAEKGPKLSTDDEELVLLLHDFLQRRNYLNNSFDDRENLEEMSIYSDLSLKRKQHTLVKNKNVRLMLGSLLEKDENNTVVVKKSVSMKDIKGRIQRKRDIKVSSDSLSGISAKVPGVSLMNSVASGSIGKKLEISRGNRYSQSKNKNSAISDLSSIGSKLLSSGQTRNLVISKDGKSEDVASSMSRHENRIRQKTLSLFDAREEL